MRGGTVATVLWDAGNTNMAEFRKALLKAYIKPGSSANGTLEDLDNRFLD